MLDKQIFKNNTYMVQEKLFHYAWFTYRNPSVSNIACTVLSSVDILQYILDMRFG